MNANKDTKKTLVDVKVNVKIKLAALWATVMFLYIYVDHFALFEPGIIETILAGESAGFQITQTWLLTAMVLMMIPSLMIFLSVALKATVNRWINLIADGMYILVVIGNIVGESWFFYIGASIVEVVLLILIVRYAWTWPTCD